MPLTKSFRETVMARAEKDAEFRLALLDEGLRGLLSGDDAEIEVGKSLIRDYINATMGFERLARETKTPKESLSRMFGAKGNPKLSKLSAVIGVLSKHERADVGVGRARRKKSAA